MNTPALLGENHTNEQEYFSWQFVWIRYALDVFAEDLKTSSLSLAEKEALTGDSTTRVMVLAKDYNYQGVAISLFYIYTIGTKQKSDANYQ